MKPYSAYRDSGIPWLGPIPTHWETRRMKYLFDERTQKGFPDAPLLAATQTKGVVPKTHYENRTVTAQKDLHLLKLVEVGDYVISLRSFQGGIERAIEYFHAIQAALKQRNSPYRAIVAFTGEHVYNDEKVTEATLNGFPGNKIEDNIQDDPYRFLICADKFQTGYDEPLLHTMYVDKPLEGIKAVQTLSRLNRACPGKDDVFVLDFINKTETIQEAFQDYYKTTILSKEADPDRLHDFKDRLDGYQVYTRAQVEELVELYLSNAPREKLDPILDACVVVYCDDLDEDGQVDFKSSARAFVRNYNFLASILPYTILEWEKLSIFLNFLVRKLPTPPEADLAKGILEAIDMESYRAQKRQTIAIALADENAEIDPAPITAGGHIPEPELDLLSNIIKEFNERFSHLAINDREKMIREITQDIPGKVAGVKAYHNAMKHSDKQSARIELVHALGEVLNSNVKDYLELYKNYKGNESFSEWLIDFVFARTYDPNPEGTVDQP